MRNLTLNAFRDVGSALFVAASIMVWIIIIALTLGTAINFLQWS